MLRGCGTVASCIGAYQPRYLHKLEICQKWLHIWPTFLHLPEITLSIWTSLVVISACTTWAWVQQKKTIMFFSWNMLLLTTGLHSSTLLNPFATLTYFIRLSLNFYIPGENNPGLFFFNWNVFLPSVLSHRGNKTEHSNRALAISCWQPHLFNCKCFLSEESLPRLNRILLNY